MPDDVTSGKAKCPHCGQRLDLGLWLGATVHLVDFSLDAQPSGRAVTKNPWYPVPALGVCFNYSILPRLYLYGKAGYFYYKVDDPITKIEAVRLDITLTVGELAEAVTVVAQAAQLETTNAALGKVVDNRATHPPTGIRSKKHGSLGAHLGSACPDLDRLCTHGQRSAQI